MLLLDKILRLLQKDVGFGFGIVEGKSAAVRHFFEGIGTVTKTGEEILGDLFEIVIKIS